MATHPELSDLEGVELDGFEVWDRTVQAPAGREKKVAFVSVRVGGVIGLNKAAREMLGRPEAVKVMFDPKRGRIGLIATSLDEENSYEICQYSGCQISCKKLFDYYGITITKARRYYDIQMIDGILVVNIGDGFDQ